MASDPLLSPWTGPHGGLPRFDAIRIGNFKPALLKAMDLNRAEIAAIVGNTAAPTFENTIAPLEDAGRPFNRVTSLFHIYRGTMSDKAVQKLDEEMAPILAAFRDEIIQNQALFDRIKTVYERRTQGGLAPDQERLVETLYLDFARRGAELADTAKARLKQINAQLASLYTKFSQNLLADEEGGMLVLRAETDLVGLPQSSKQAARQAAEEKQQPGSWVIANTRSAMEPFLTYSTRRDLREKAWRLWVSRGDNPGDHNNKPVIRDILALREEKAKILGYQSYAHWFIADNMAKTPEAALALCMKVWPAARARVHEEVAEMKQLARADGVDNIAPWDYRFYAEKVRKARYDLDADEVKQYLQLDKMREAMMWAAGQLYGLSFDQVTDVPVVHPDVTVYKVSRGGTHVGLWYFDPYARDGKESGAWMSEYRTQESFREVIAPIVSNNSNFVKASGAVLISWDDAQTMFHEFGHALHGLNSAVRYPTLAGTSTKRDFVEFPSQLNEYWLRTPEVLGRFAVHHQTGKPMPSELVAKIERAKHFNEGFRTIEYLACAIYDLKIHTAPAAGIDPEQFERHTMQELGMPAEIVMRHRPTQFGHLFTGEGYSAGYYSYLWADTLTADAAEAFVAAGSFYDKTLAKRLLEFVLSVGNSIPPDVAFKNFRGRDADVSALMRSRGFAIQ
jgi:peptidyl-dipeptidase Dcp